MRSPPVSLLQHGVLMHHVAGAQPFLADCSVGPHGLLLCLNRPTGNRRFRSRRTLPPVITRCDILILPCPSLGCTRLARTSTAGPADRFIRTLPHFHFASFLILQRFSSSSGRRSPSARSASTPAQHRAQTTETEFTILRRDKMGHTLAAYSSACCAHRHIAPVDSVVVASAPDPVGLRWNGKKRRKRREIIHGKGRRGEGRGRTCNRHSNLTCWRT